jgi:hypothetical protein
MPNRRTGYRSSKYISIVHQKAYYISNTWNLFPAVAAVLVEAYKNRFDSDWALQKASDVGYPFSSDILAFFRLILDNRPTPESTPQPEMTSRTFKPREATHNEAPKNALSLIPCLMLASIAIVHQWPWSLSRYQYLIVIYYLIDQ